MSPCAVIDCGRASHARNLCHTHYDRWYKGDTSLPAAESVFSNDNLPNPWAHVAPPCPNGHPPAEVFLWHPDPEDGLGKWLCSPCGRRFSAERAA